MTNTLISFGYATAHRRVGPALLARQPAWVWSLSGETIIWSNEAGCRFFHSKSLPDLLGRKFRRISPATVQIARMGRTARAGDTQDAVLRFFLGMDPVAVSTQLTRISLASGEDAIFVEARDWSDEAEAGPRSKAAVRFAKLFSRGNESAALITPAGDVDQSSDKFRSHKIKRASLKAVSNFSADDAVAVALDDGSVLNAFAARDTDGEIAHIFATITAASDGLPVLFNQTPIDETDDVEDMERADDAPSGDEAISNDPQDTALPLVGTDESADGAPLVASSDTPTD
ncbi:MAG: hypothetical protein AAFW47_08930, partial [Pseudomonadota bacterium]